MSLRRAIVEVDTKTVNVAEFCRCHGISRVTFYDVRRRYDAEGEVGLAPKSRAPSHPAGRTSDAVQDAIVAKRKELDDAGWDGGPESIAFYLRDLPGVPSVSTIWRILKARGVITAQPAKAPKSAGRSFTAERANECWALDDTDWVLGDGTAVKILNVEDDHSRYCVASTAMLSCTGAATLAVLAAAAAWLGWPARFWSDNAQAFKATLATALAPIGVIASHSRPHHPQGNGKIERFHQTLQKWLTKQPTAATIDELQQQLDRFRDYYNTKRPHRALRRRTPAEVWTDALKDGPSTRPLGTPTTVHHTLVSHGRCYTGRWAITIGAQHDGQRALAVITGTAGHVFIDGHLVRQLTIDPTKRSQPLHQRTGRPPTVREAPRHV